MYIRLADKKIKYHLTYEKIRRLLTSGLTPEQWTKANIQKTLH